MIRSRTVIPVHRTNDDWTRETTEALRRHARLEFASKGFADASVERVAAQAGVTKGAVYYHFTSKEGLFEAVLHDVERELVARIEQAAMAERDPVQALVAGSLAFLQLAMDDALRQIALVDGPAVLGWSRWRAIDAAFGLGSLKEGLQACQEAGRLRDLDTAVLAHLISGALNEAAFLVAAARDRRASFDAASRTITALVARLDHPERAAAARPRRERARKELARD